VSNVLVAGGSGFIGTYCVMQLLAAGPIVRTTVRDLKSEAGVRAMLNAASADAGDRLLFDVADLEEGVISGVVCRSEACFRRKGSSA
jgi:dihydroflavonol-4-reductase